MGEASEKLDRFKPAMPRIPGMTDRPTAPAPAAEVSRAHLMRIVVPLVAAFAVGAVTAWWMLRAPHSASPAPALPAQAPATSAAGAPPGAASVTAVVPAYGAADVATLQELAKPWSSKKFLFRKRLTDETVPALVVRLPGGAANRSASYWAFSLQAPYGRCELEYVTALDKLAGQYGYRARHPMVGDPCSGTLYDPLRLGTVPGGAWARGEVVQGSSIRPPIAIEIRVQGNHLIASQIE